MSISLFETFPSYAMERPSSDFQNYFSKVIKYKVYSTKTNGDYREVKSFGSLSDNKIISNKGKVLTLKEKLEKRSADESEAIDERAIASTLIRLSENFIHFYDIVDKDVDEEAANNKYTYLELLFEKNLGWIAEEICNNIIESGNTLDAKYKILLQIYQGEKPEINSDYLNDLDFIYLAYKVANNSDNVDMVRILYAKLPNENQDGIKQNSQTLKETYPELYHEYIHEPYWSYNVAMLQDYGYRIIDKLRPYLIEKRFVHVNVGEKWGTKYVKLPDGSVVPSIYVKLPNDEEIPVREVPFGYVLPNLYLKEKLVNSKELAVARLFIIPKNTVKLTFLMPYTPDYSENLKYGDSGFNPLQILSEDFVVYQELIDGDGDLGDRSFSGLGHSDFNAVQIIKSNKDGKKYLIDTKEQKNFFIPCLSPDRGKEACTYGIFLAKTLHFDRRKIFVNINVDLDK